MNIEPQVWSTEETELLYKNMNHSLDELYILFDGNRSKESIRKKKKRILKNKKTDISVNIIGDIPVSKIEEKIILTSTPNGQNQFYKKYTENNNLEETTLVVPDAHTDPEQDNSRFISLGKYANDKKPNNIVFMGDFCNFDSLSSFDAGKEASHGKKYKEEIKTGRDALKLFKDQLDEDYKPRLCFLGGNHDEGRIEKYIETHPLLRGHLDIQEDLRLGELGFEYIPYKRFLEIQGVLFTHAVMNAANTPVSGKSVMSIIASLTAKSIVVGHHHRFEAMSYYRHGADDVHQVLLCGLFSEETSDYADGAANSYSRCIVMLHHYAPGRFDIDQISIQRLKAKYK